MRQRQLSALSVVDGRGREVLEDRQVTEAGAGDLPIGRAADVLVLCLDLAKTAELRES